MIPTLKSKYILSNPNVELQSRNKCERNIWFHSKKLRHICLEFPKGGLEGLFGTPTRNSRTPINLPHQHCSRVKTGRHCKFFCNKTGIIISTPNSSSCFNKKLENWTFLLENKQWVNDQLLEKGLRQNTIFPT